MFKKGDKVCFKQNWREIANECYPNKGIINKIERHQGKILTYKKGENIIREKRKCICEEEKTWFLYEDFLEFAREENEL